MSELSPCMLQHGPNLNLENKFTQCLVFPQALPAVSKSAHEMRRTIAYSIVPEMGRSIKAICFVDVKRRPN